MKTKCAFFSKIATVLTFALLPLFIIGCQFNYEMLGKTLVVAHRGASGYEPENTLAAFNKAWEQNADVIEGDFYLTTDNRVVCCHDATTGRTANKNLSVTKSTYAELKALDFGDDKGIPLLEEVLDTLVATKSATKSINIEIKDKNLQVVDHTAKIVKQYIDGGKLNWKQIRVIAFDPEACIKAKELMPNAACSILKVVGSELDENELLKFMDKYKIEGCSFNAPYPRAEIFSYKLRLSGHEAHVWTVNSVRDAKRFINMGFNSITTNYPDKMLEIRK